MLLWLSVRPVRSLSPVPAIPVLNLTVGLQCSPATFCFQFVKFDSVKLMQKTVAQVSILVSRSWKSHGRSRKCCADIKEIFSACIHLSLHVPVLEFTLQQRVFLMHCFWFILLISELSSTSCKVARNTHNLCTAKCWYRSKR